MKKPAPIAAVLALAVGVMFVLAVVLALYSQSNLHDGFQGPQFTTPDK